MRASPVAIFLFIFAGFLGAVGQFFYKSGAERTSGSVASYLFNARLFAGVICYIGVMALFVAAFKKGGALTVLYRSMPARLSGRQLSHGWPMVLPSVARESPACSSLSRECICRAVDERVTNQRHSASGSSRDWLLHDRVELSLADPRTQNTRGTISYRNTETSCGS
jgi:hypothetical protein